MVSSGVQDDEERHGLGIRTVANLVADSVTGLEGVTIGEALLAAAQLLGSKLVDSRDVAAIQSALVARSEPKILIVKRAQSAANINAGASTSATGITLSHILADAQDCTVGNEMVTKEVAERVARAEKE